MAAASSGMTQSQRFMSIDAAYFEPVCSSPYDSGTAARVAVSDREAEY